MHVALLLVLALLVGCAAPPGGGAPATGPLAVGSGARGDSAPAAALHWTVEDADGRALGSATAIGPGLLLTNRHVIGGHAGLAVRRPGEGARPVLAVARSDRADAALLRVAAAGTPGVVATAAAPLSGAAVSAAGLHEGSRQVTSGAAGGSLDAVRAGPGHGVARIAAAPGFSGGPVLDGQDRLVGIVVAAMLESRAEAYRLAAAGPAAPLEQRLLLYLPIGMLLGDPAIAPWVGR